MLAQICSPSRVYQPTELRPSISTACLPKKSLAALSCPSLSSQHHNLNISTQIKPYRVYQPTELRPSMATDCLPKKSLAALSFPSLSSQHHNLNISTQIKQKKDMPFIAQYLISSFGFSEERAIRLAGEPQLSSIETASKPDSVVRFFKDTGLTDEQIHNLISWWPLLLASNVKKTLKSRAPDSVIRFFKDTGLTDKEIGNMISWWPLLLASIVEKTLKPRAPDPVVRFCKDTGLNNKEIRNLISWWPSLLASNVEKTLKPRTNELMTAGFTGDSFLELIKCNPMALILKNTLYTLQFWISFLGKNEKALLKVIKKNPKLMNVDVNTNIIPKMNLLREFGLSDKQIARLVSQTRVILKKPDNIRLLLERTVNLGFQRGSKMFIYGLMTVSFLKHDTIKRKIKFFKNTHNWSEAEINWAINKCPSILKHSEENLKSKVDFLVANFGFDARSIAQHSSILTYSLKGRLISRHYVINMLQLKGLKIIWCPHSVIKMTEEIFFEKLIEAYKEEVPELGDSYAAFLDGKMSN